MTDRSEDLAALEAFRVANPPRPERPRQCLTDGCRNVAVKGRSRCPKCGGGGFEWSKPMPPGWGTTRAAHLRIEPNCRVCGRPAVTVDHILARAFGGTDHESNL
jgi:5-methylcytosine-specific restriction endonuclease McrA